MRLNHVAICTLDTDQLKDFYIDVFGLRIVKEKCAGKILWLAPSQAENWKIVLMHGEPKVASGDFDHFALEVESQGEVSEIARRGSSRGAIVHPCKQGDASVGYHVVLRDPIGNLIEVNWYGT